MSDFIAGYISGAAGILLGSPLDIVKVHLQNSLSSTTTLSQTTSAFTTPSSLLRGTAAPILTYGALNGLLFTSYNRALSYLPAPLANPFNAGLIGGFATFIVSQPAEVIKCRSQLLGMSSLAAAKALGVRGMFYGGGVTVLRDAIGYGFYFQAYEEMRERGVGVLLAGGVAGCVSWASIYPLDVVKTRVQGEVRGEGLLSGEVRRVGAWECARRAWVEEGAGVFWRGLSVCMVRAFFVNAVQWAVYEYIMMALREDKLADDPTPAFV